MISLLRKICSITFNTHFVFKRTNGVECLIESDTVRELGSLDKVWFLKVS